MARNELELLRGRVDEACATLPAGQLDRERQHPRRGLLTGREGPSWSRGTRPTTGARRS